MKFTSVLLSAALTTAQSRLLSQEPIGTFSPITQVTDHAAIDLDQAEIESLVSEQKFGEAQRVYEEGANSKSVANLGLVSGLQTELPAKTIVTGTDTQGNAVSGKVYKTANSGSTSLQIQYATSDSQDNHVGCRVGGSSAPVTDGCFASEGSINVNGVVYSYTYTILEDNFNGRNIKGFNTATSKHHIFGDTSNLFYPDFDAFQKYYGATDYADRLVTAAFTGTDARLSRGNQNYVGKDPDARVEGAKKGTAYLNIFMYVIRELEDALDDCEKGCDRDDCNDDAVHALDEAVAFYTGSTEGNGDNGNLLYSLAEKRCNNFNTCGSARAKVNSQIFTQFKAMQNNLLKKECSVARKNKDRIVDLMYVPMIQGALRYSYFQGYQNDATAKSNAEGAAFAAAVLPRIHACDEGDAAAIYDNLRLGSNDVDHDDVKKSFERNYSCMRITCEDIGGLSDGEAYFDGAEPCSQKFSSTSAGKAVAGVGISGAVILAAGFAFLVARRNKSNATSSTVDRQLEMGSQDIA